MREMSVEERQAEIRWQLHELLILQSRKDSPMADRVSVIRRLYQLDDFDRASLVSALVEYERELFLEGVSI